MNPIGDPFSSPVFVCSEGFVVQMVLFVLYFHSSTSVSLQKARRYHTKSLEVVRQSFPKTSRAQPPLQRPSLLESTHGVSGVEWLRVSLDYGSARRWRGTELPFVFVLELARSLEGGCDGLLLCFCGFARIQF